jgi:hypothetical protein
VKYTIRRRRLCLIGPLYMRMEAHLFIGTDVGT